jgi:YYY domain-containing protein
MARNAAKTPTWRSWLVVGLALGLVWLLSPLGTTVSRAAGPQPTATPTPIASLAPEMLNAPVADLPVLNDRGWNTLANTSTVAAILCWYLVLLLLGLLLWPLLALLLPRASDAGYGLAKGLGLLCLAYLVWIGASLRLWPNTAVIVWVIASALGLLIIGLAWLRRRALRDVWQRARRTILLEEGIFLAAFLGMVGIRLLNPDLWHPYYGGEKMMEIAILNALGKSAYFPPYDPFFAGGTLNYYYYGQYLCNVLLKLTGISPEVGFNLCVPTFFALTALQAFTLGRWLATPSGDITASARRRALWGGFGALAFVLLLANLNVLVQLVAGVAIAGGASFDIRSWSLADLRYLGAGVGHLLSGQSQLPAFDYWTMATRIIPNTINEFPFFTYLFADLHPHLIALPLTILVLNLTLSTSTADSLISWRVLPVWALVALTLGALGPTNTWDLPTYGTLILVYLVLRDIHKQGWRGALQGVLVALGVGALAITLYLPFYQHYQPLYTGIRLVPEADRSGLAPFIIVWGLQLFFSLSLLMVEWRQSWPWTRFRQASRRYGWRRTWFRWWRLGWPGVRRALVAILLAAVAISVALVFALRGSYVLALLTLAVVASGALLLLPQNEPRVLARRLMLTAAFAILWIIEIIYLADFLAGSDWLRMNTVFKFGLQAWVLLGLALGSVLPELWRRIRRPSWLGVIWQISAMLLLVIAGLYLPLAIRARVLERFPTPPTQITLDGTAYMTSAVYSWPDLGSHIELRYDRQAIEWLWRNVAGTPVLVEAAVGYYREGGSRISAYTGLPTLVGGHESEQRPWEIVLPREQAVAELYTTTSEERLWDILRQYDVRYIYLGQLERLAYPGPGLDKFNRLATQGKLELVYANERTEIYRIP